MLDGMVRRKRNMTIKRLLELQYFCGEYVTDLLIPAGGPTPFWRSFFRMPLFLYRWGLHSLISNHVLIMTTKGRKTGRQHSTPVGYDFDPHTGVYYVVAGWKGKTDWYRNALAHQVVKITVGPSSFDAIATPLTEDEIAARLAAYAKRNPFAPRLFFKLTGIRADGTHETFRKMAPFYPALALRRTDTASNR